MDSCVRHGRHAPDQSGTHTAQARRPYRRHQRLPHKDGQEHRLKRLPGADRQYKSKDLEHISQAAAHGKLNLPIARTVPLPQAIDALTELENNHTPKGGKLVITLP